MTEDFEADRKILEAAHWEIPSEDTGGDWHARLEARTRCDLVSRYRWPAALQHIADAHALLREIRELTTQVIVAGKIDEFFGSVSEPRTT
jgi:hypothetical protein